MNLMRKDSFHFVVEPRCWFPRLPGCTSGVGRLCFDKKSYQNQKVCKNNP
jgi:hypothetical protein